MNWKNYWKNKNHVKKKRVKDYRSLDASIFSKIPLHSQVLVNGVSGSISSQGLHLCAFSNPKLEMCIPLQRTACHFGGSRIWFLCPNVNCTRRCKKLYLVTKEIFLCRKCLRLVYNSQNTSPLDNLIRKIL